MKKRLAPSLSKGFTLIELLVVISVTGILSAIGIAAFVNYSRQQQVTQAVNDLKNNLRIAQSKALTQEIPSGCNNFSAYELKFADDGKSYTVYPICSLPGQPPVISINFPSTVSKVQGPDTIRFKILTGAVDGAGTVVMCGFNNSLAVTVTNVGGIESAPASSTLCPTPTPTPAPTPTSTPTIAPTLTPTTGPTPTPSATTYTIATDYSGNQGPRWWYYYKQAGSPQQAVFESGPEVWWDVPAGSPYWNAPGFDWMMLSPGYSLGGDSETAVLYWQSPQKGMATMEATDQRDWEKGQTGTYKFGLGYAASVGNWTPEPGKEQTVSDNQPYSLTLTKQMSGTGDALFYYKDSIDGTGGDGARYTVTVTFTPN